jgi:hypothetical protein
MPEQDPIDPELQAFLVSSVRSVWALETLLFLRAHRERAWSIAALTAELRSGTIAVTEALAVFEAAGLVLREDEHTYRYGPASPDLDRMVESLRLLYADRPVAVRTAILNSPREKITTFANAFRFDRRG